MNDAPRLAERDFTAALALDRDNADAHNGRGLARAQLGQHKEAVADAEAALRRGPRDSRHCYNAARVFAEAVRAVDDDPAEKNLRGQQAREHYEDRAVRLLREALDLRPAAERQKFWKDTVARDPAFKSLHPSLGFRRLTEELLGAAR
jgi:tetratricopeptide (TPR) repeat protein